MAFEIPKTSATPRILSHIMYISKCHNVCKVINCASPLHNIATYKKLSSVDEALGCNMDTTDDPTQDAQFLNIENEYTLIISNCFSC